MWSELYNKTWHYYESKWVQEDLVIVLIQSVNTKLYKVAVKCPETFSYVWSSKEKDIEVSKIKGLTKAKQLGWDISQIKLK